MSYDAERKEGIVKINELDAGLLQKIKEAIEKLSKEESREEEK